MIKLKKLHHVAIICSDYKKSKQFYTETLGFKIKQEVYRKERTSFKLDLELNDNYVIELFSFPDPPPRVSRPEATGLRHIAFEVENIEICIQQLAEKNIVAEPIRIDEYTSKKFSFIFDPDNLPIELYEV
jgi:glyoxylase I family protein